MRPEGLTQEDCKVDGVEVGDNVVKAAGQAPGQAEQHVPEVVDVAGDAPPA